VASEAAESGSSRSFALSAAVAIGVVAVDQLTKRWAIDRLGDGSTIDLIWTLRFNLAFNSGMAFGKATGFGPVIAVVATGVIVWLLVSLRNRGSVVSSIGIGLVLGGAIGNLIDRVARGDGFLDGAVVDFIDLQWFPIFNVADMAVNIGAGLLILSSVLSARARPVEAA
jgi:signal peptidase II